MSANYWLLLALGAAMLWGIAYTLDERVMEHMAVTQFMFLSGVFCTVLLGGWLLATGQMASLPQRVMDTPPLILWSSLSITLTASVAILASIKLANASIAALLEISYPIFTILFAWLIFGKVQVNLPVICGGGLILAGSFIVARFADF